MNGHKQLNKRERLYFIRSEVCLVGKQKLLDIGGKVFIYTLYLIALLFSVEFSGSFNLPEDYKRHRNIFCLRKVKSFYEIIKLTERWQKLVERMRIFVAW